LPVVDEPEDHPSGSSFSSGRHAPVATALTAPDPALRHPILFPLAQIMIDNQSSLRLKLLRFPPIIGVMYIHAYGTVIHYPGGSFGTADLNSLTNVIRILLSEGIARTAVPLFFLMSGYLFFATFHWSQQTYLAKILSRLRSLLIPFLFWNLAVLAFFALAQAVPATQPYFTGLGKKIAEYGLFDYVNAVFGLTGYPIAYHFWFIRDLMLLVLLAPALAAIVRFVPIPFFLAVYVCWVTESWPVSMPGAVGVFFFSAGALCGIREQSLFAFDRFSRVIYLIYAPLLIADVVWYEAWFNVYIHRTGLIFGVLAALCVTRQILGVPWLCKGLVALGGASFFVYAAHEPLLGVARLLAFKYVPLDGAYTMLALYLGIPLLVTATLAGCHSILRMLCPRLLSLITGGR
jgi:surface polysaccharide O-acyltransferase-like enzyme